uniref:Carbonic anhydrase n=1 Tax=Ficedula albicollis TaxID=59894 RepID=A0A803V5Z5_FICAL
MSISRGLPGLYRAVQMHLHWGGLELESSGSEHTIDGMRHFAELHIVHYNSANYSSFEEAKDKPQGLAVLAFLYTDGHFENTYYSEFISKLARIRFAGEPWECLSLSLIILPACMHTGNSWHSILSPAQQPAQPRAGGRCSGQQ